MTTSTNTLDQTLDCLVSGLGTAVGEQIKTEIETLLGMPSVDLTAIQSAIAQIQSLLDADAGTEGFQVGQNIVTQLIALGNRIDALENSTVVAQLQVLVNSIDAGLTAEIARATAAEAALSDQIAGLTSTVNALSDTVAGLGTPSSGCDCVAIAGQIAALQTAVGNLQGVDASQAAQIATLQEQLANMATAVATATAAADAATAAANAATVAANAATSGLNALQTAVDALDSRETERHNGHNGRLSDLEGFKAGVEAIDCAAKVALFRAAMSAARSA